MSTDGGCKGSGKEQWSLGDPWISRNCKVVVDRHGQNSDGSRDGGTTTEEKEQLRHQPQPAKGSQNQPKPVKKPLAQGSSVALYWFVYFHIFKKTQCIPS